jgi:uncharacterized membrane protein YgcG
MRTLVIAATAVLLLSPPSQNPADLDRVLAPIALYPDQLLAQILLCAADPGQVVELENWLAKNSALKGTALQDEATAANFEPSFVALVLFPQVVHQMAADQTWTTQLGQAFAADRAGVFASIQRLRAQAQQAGKLKDTSQQNVETRTTESGQQVIVIEPANPQVVYVPQYDPQVVYSAAPTTVVIQDDDDTAEAVAAGLIGFTAGIAIGAAMDNNYYYGPYGFHGGFYMYNDAWDDWYDHREDAREDWMDHREDVMDNRGDRAETRQDQRTDRTDSRQGARSDTQGQRTERQATRQETRPATPATSARTSSAEARGYGGDNAQLARERSGTKSDAFSGYSSGKSTRAASSRGQSSRSSSGGGRRGGGGRR